MKRAWAVLATVVVFSKEAGAADKAAPVAVSVTARLITADGTTLWATDAENKATSFTAARPEIREQLKRAQPGDHLSLIATDTVIESVEPSLVATTRNARLAAFGAAAGVMLLLLSFLYRSGALMGADGRYSKSKAQAALWFALLVAGYVATAVVRGMALHGRAAGGIGIPLNLLVASGLSAATFVIAKGIAVGQAASIAKTAGDSRGFLQDLIASDTGRADLGDLQMLIGVLLTTGVWSLRLVQSLSLVSDVAFIDLPDLDSALLAISGVGQGAYLTKKAVDKPAALVGKAPVDVAEANAPAAAGAAGGRA